MIGTDTSAVAETSRYVALNMCANSLHVRAHHIANRALICHDHDIRKLPLLVPVRHAHPKLRNSVEILRTTGSTATKNTVKPFGRFLLRTFSIEARIWLFGGNGS